MDLFQLEMTLVNAMNQTARSIWTWSKTNETKQTLQIIRIKFIITDLYISHALLQIANNLARTIL